MKRKTKITALITTGLLLIGGLSACGHHYKQRNPEARAEYIIEKITNKLDLNDTQVSKLQVIKSEILEIRERTRQQRGDTHDTILSLLQQPTLDQQKLLDTINGHTQTINDNAPRIVSLLADFYDNLNPEQQKELQEHVEDRFEHHRHGRYDD